MYLIIFIVNIFLTVFHDMVTKNKLFLDILINKSKVFNDGYIILE